MLVAAATLCQCLVTAVVDVVVFVVVDVVVVVASDATAATFLYQGLGLQQQCKRDEINQNNNNINKS